MNQQKPLTALVIDDHQGVRESLKWILKGIGINTDYAETTQEGLDKLAQKPYDLVFTDLNQTPTGLEVFNDAVSRGIKKTYIMTGEPIGELFSQARIVAGDKLIIKPFDLEDIERIIGQEPIQS